MITGSDKTSENGHEDEQSTTRADLIKVGAPVAILVVGFVLFFTIGKKPVAEEKPTDPDKRPSVLTMQVVPHTSGLTFEVEGDVQPYEEFTLSAEVSGPVIYKAEFCRAGNFAEQDSRKTLAGVQVEEMTRIAREIAKSRRSRSEAMRAADGRLLVEIDSRDYVHQVSQLASQNDRQDAALQELAITQKNLAAKKPLIQQQLDLKIDDLNRARDLSGNQIVTNSELNNTRDKKFAAEIIQLNTIEKIDLLKPQRVKLEMDRDDLRAKLRQSALDLARTEVRSPVAGRIVSVNVREGDFVNKGDPLLTVEDVSKVEVKCMLRVDQMQWIWDQESTDGDNKSDPKGHGEYFFPKTPVSVIYELAGRRYSWEGRLDRYDGGGLNDSRMVPCVVVVDRPHDSRRIGSEDSTAGDAPVGPPKLDRNYYVTVQILARPRTRLLRVPASAIRPGERIWRVRDGKLTIVSVRIANETDETALIYADSAALSSNDRVVISPLPSVQDGMEVKERSD